MNATKAKTFNQLAADYTSYDAAIAAAEKKKEAIKTELIAMVTRFGAVPSKAEKSKRIESDLYEATVSTGTATEIDQDAVKRLYTAFIAKSGSGLGGEHFECLFSSSTKFSLAEGAHEALVGKLPKAALPRGVRALFRACFSVKPKKPTLKVVAKSTTETKTKKASA